jgi:hypothetical protein
MDFDVQCVDVAKTLSNPLKLEIHLNSLPASAYDRDKWQAVENTVMNLRIS